MSSPLFAAAMTCSSREGESVLVSTDSRWSTGGKFSLPVNRLSVVFRSDAAILCRREVIVIVSPDGGEGDTDGDAGYSGFGFCGMSCSRGCCCNGTERFFAALRRFREETDREIPAISIKPLKKAIPPTTTMIQSKRLDGIRIKSADFLLSEGCGAFVAD